VAKESRPLFRLSWVWRLPRPTASTVAEGFGGYRNCEMRPAVAVLLRFSVTHYAETSLRQWLGGREHVSTNQDPVFPGRPASERNLGQAPRRADRVRSDRSERGKRRLVHDLLERGSC
jgi:hypothetical protein